MDLRVFIIIVLSYTNHKGNSNQIKIYAKNPYGLRYSFDKHLTELFIAENSHMYNSNDFKIDIKSVDQTVTHDGNEYLKKYSNIYSFNEEIDWTNILSEHHYIRIEMKKSSDLTSQELLKIKELLSDFGNVEYIYFIDNVKYKFLLMDGEEIEERLLSNYYNDYRKMFLKTKFKY